MRPAYAASMALAATDERATFRFFGALRFAQPLFANIDLIGNALTQFIILAVFYRAVNFGHGDTSS